METTFDKVLIIGMVGLPARGKSYISRKIDRFSSWIGYKPKVFNVGNYRRSKVGVNVNFGDFFDPKNEQSEKLRQECALLALQDLCNHINNRKVNIAILDATNTTYSRRKLINTHLQKNLKCKYSLIWIESICNIDDIIINNIKETKIKSADYIHWENKDLAIEDFKQRIKQYEEVYQSIDPDIEGPDTRFIKIIDQGRKIKMNNIFGFIESKLISYLINLHIGDRAVYFSRHGESIFNTLNKIGGDSSLSEEGKEYAEKLAEYFSDEFKEWKGVKPKLYCSTLKRALETSQILLDKSGIFDEYSSQKCLDEISTGIRDGYSYEEIREKFPDEYAERSRDKLHYRYPRGESYMDVIRRIEPMIFEIERSTNPLVIIGHQGMLRCLYGYFSNTPIEKIPTMDIPLHTVIKFKPKDYGFYEERFCIDQDTGKISKLNLKSEVRMDVETAKLSI